MIIEVPQGVVNDGSGKDWKFDTAAFQLTEESINEQSTKIASAYSEWAYVAAKLRKNLLDLERQYNDWEPKATAVVEAEAKQSGIIFKSEKAKGTALYNHKDGTGKYDYAEVILKYENKKDELNYYIDLVETAILKPLSIEKDMIVSIGANIRAGMGVQTTTV